MVATDQTATSSRTEFSPVHAGATAVPVPPLAVPRPGRRGTSPSSGIPSAVRTYVRALGARVLLSITIDPFPRTLQVRDVPFRDGMAAAGQTAIRWCRVAMRV